MERYNWEYIVRTFARNTDEHMELELRRLGDSCWELVTVTAADGNYTAFLKRKYPNRTRAGLG